MKNERRIKVDFPNVDLTMDDISREYISAGKDIVESGAVPNVDMFIKNLDEYNRLQYRLMEKTEKLCRSMETMEENEFVIVNSFANIFDDIDKITERMDSMIYFVPRDDVLDVLERYLSLHKKLFDKPVFYVESGWDKVQEYEL
ncbi:hypothetical protein CUJ83_07365 [Methanocella sp. CWC-04]|uniref:Uncharacterized protein n=1 Tax=Methanooceanicella nereidis TaxID=2052831 RepID=A0AAP2RDJ2_9EURY|nr:hypothetical protein [Methanocella sp. CWC-04]MCD1294816.1 hypothetical protein [Methanocella sp. CWC-04]